MFKQASGIIGSEILALEANLKIGEVSDFIIEPESGKIVALLLKKRLFAPPKIVSPQDIIDIVENSILVRSQEDATSLEEVVRAKEILAGGITFLGTRVETESGTHIGKVRDFIFDYPNFVVLKLYVQTNLLRELFQNELIIPTEKIVQVTKKAIIVSDDVISGSKVKGALPAG